MTDKPTVHEALANVMGEVSHVAKRDHNEFQNFNFRGIDAVVNAVGPALRKHGVIITPVVADVRYDTVSTSNGKPSTACRVLVDYVFHGPAGDTMTARVIGEAWDTGDKAAPKAMSVAFRTALLQALTLPTDDPDPDHAIYERGDGPARPTESQMVRIGGLMHERGIVDEGQLPFVAEVIGRQIGHPNELTLDEATALETHLRTLPIPDDGEQT
ncbi:hypothetical protein GCM10022234_00640 [Aeromicrobium panaciterrae]|uniref:ERF family protein n=1 Tax=Aeromicrobium panaciterrae TaxID=363861 RepID=UPI0031DCD17E